ncbi:MAG: hypothetical protein RLZZ505_916 [Verrucomicrobiota bacterium]|jgi:hypothetical protein
MQALSLKPLPFDNSEESRSHRRLRSEGFVDEELVSGLIERGLYERAFAQPEDMVLSSSEDDYAGWALPVPSPFRGMRDIQDQEAAPATIRRPSPPVPANPEDGIETAYAGGHRWWVFGVSGAMACGLLALTLLSLAQRAEVQEIAAGYVPVPIKAEVPTAIAAEPVLQPALTNAPHDFR